MLKYTKPKRLLNKNFMLLWQGQLVSQVGNSAFSIAMMFWLMQKTGSASLMGLIMMVSAIPAVVLSPLSGVFADRYSRRKIIIFSDFIRGILILCFAGLVFLMPGAPDSIIIALFAVAVLSSIVTTFFGPAITASIPRLVPPEKLMKANSMNMVSQRFTDVVGQGLGGILFRILGAPVMFFIDGISYIFSAVSELFIKIPQEFPESQFSAKSKFADFLHDIMEGLRFIFTNRGLTFTIFSFSLLNFLITPLFVLLPFFVADFLKATVDWYGYIGAAFGIGSILGYSVAGMLKISGRERRFLLILSIFIGSALLGILGLMTGKEAAVILMLVWGITNGFLNVVFMTILQQTTPDWIRGRVFSVLTTLGSGLMPIGMGLTGVAADLLGQNIPLIFVICSLLSILISIIATCSRKFRDYLAYEAPKEKENITEDK